VCGQYLQCPHPASVFILGWCRAWTFIYFNKGIRSAFTTLLRVFTRLVPLTFLLLSFYLIHFFIFQTLSTGPVGIKTEHGWGAGDGASVWDALYDLFSLLTTVNHPDTMMWLVDLYPLAFAAIMSYMFFTSIIGLNLLLGIVYGDYVEILETDNKALANLRAQMVMSAFELYTKNMDTADAYMRTDDLRNILRAILQDDLEADEELDEDRVELIVRLVDAKSSRKIEGEDLAAAQDDRIDRQVVNELIESCFSQNE
jgi:hypothetical protein